MSGWYLGILSIDADCEPTVTTGLDHDGLVREKPTARLDTLTSSVLFSWPAVTAGHEIALEWPEMLMPWAMWDDLVTMREAETVYTLTPNVGGPTYQVMLTGLEGRQHAGGMLNVRLTLNVRS